MTNVVDFILSYIYVGLPIPTTKASNTVSSWNVKQNKTFNMPMFVGHAFRSNHGAIVISSYFHLKNWRIVNTCLYQAQMMLIKRIYCINANDDLINPYNLGQIISILLIKICEIFTLNAYLNLNVFLICFKLIFAYIILQRWNDPTKCQHNIKFLKFKNPEMNISNNI